MVEMNHEIWIEADKEKIYKAFATVDGLKAWWTSETEFDKDNKTLKFGFYEGKYWMKFKILETNKNKDVKWKCIETDDITTDWIDTEVKISVEKVKDDLRVYLTHSNWKKDSKILAMCNSTWGHLMFSLKDFVETGEGNPMS